LFNLTISLPKDKKDPHISESDYEKGYFKGSKKQAILNYYKYHGISNLMGKKLKVMNASLEVFNQYSESLRVYFESLKLLTYSFLIYSSFGIVNSILHNPQWQLY